MNQQTLSTKLNQQILKRLKHISASLREFDPGNKLQTQLQNVSNDFHFSSGAEGVMTDESMLFEKITDLRAKQIEKETPLKKSKKEKAQKFMSNLFKNSSSKNKEEKYSFSECKPPR